MYEWGELETVVVTLSVWTIFILECNTCKLLVCSNHTTINHVSAACSDDHAR